MKRLITAKSAGFCAGVEHSVALAEKALMEEGTVWCLGELIHNWDEVERLASLGMKTADSIEEIKTVCWCGKKATFNARICDGKVIKDGNQIMLGGNESYVALCRKHWAEGNLGNKN